METLFVVLSLYVRRGTSKEIWPLRGFFTVSLIQGSYPFLNKQFKNFSRTFKDTFPIFQGLNSVQKRALSLGLFCSSAT